MIDTTEAEKIIDLNDKRLEQCAIEIRKRSDRIITDCFEIGKQLLIARDLLRHQGAHGEQGRWLEWLKIEARKSHVQARRFIQVYERYGKVAHVGQFTFNTDFRVL